MNAQQLDYHLSLPAGVDRATGALVSLQQVLRAPASAAPNRDLPAAQAIALIKARWLAGEWSDLVYSSYGLIDRDRAIRELESQSELGRRLMALALRAIEMAREDVAAQWQGGSP